MTKWAERKSAGGRRGSDAEIAAKTQGLMLWIGGSTKKEV